VPDTKQSGAKLYSIAALTIEELETGLRNMDGDDVDLQAFWDKNIAPFRQTILLAIRETSESLCAADIPLPWRATLESQLEDLVRYLELANRYMERRSVSLERALKSYPSSRVH
jgi:hypothetical protein